MSDIKTTRWKGASRLAGSDLEDLLALELRAAGVSEPKRQYRFHTSRRWLADFCWTCERLIVEVNGMTHVASRGHTSYAGIHRDYEKANGAQDMGYRYYQFDREMIEDGTALDTIIKAMEAG
jgi:very-short-patch-repair endonuclease